MTQQKQGNSQTNPNYLGSQKKRPPSKDPPPSEDELKCGDCLGKQWKEVFEDSSPIRVKAREVIKTPEKFKAMGVDIEVTRFGIFLLLVALILAEVLYLLL